MPARFLRLGEKTARKLSDLISDAENDGKHRVARRLQAVLLNSQGPKQRTSGEIAQILQAPRSKVSFWLAQYEKHGWKALLEGHRSGRPKELTPAQLVQLYGLIDRGPIAYGFSSRQWTSPKIGRLITNEFGVTYHPGHVRRLFKAARFSALGLRRKTGKAEPWEQDRWQRYTDPKLPKKKKIETPARSSEMTSQHIRKG